MNHINLDKVEIQYIVHYSPTPTVLNPFYEIVSYLDYLDRDVFTELEYSTKTKFKIYENKSDEIAELIKLGYITQEGRGKKYKIISHPWS